MTPARSVDRRSASLASPATKRHQVVAVVLVGLLLRLLRVPARWSVTAWLYSAYPADTVQALQEVDGLGLLRLLFGHLQSSGCLEA